MAGHDTAGAGTNTETGPYDVELQLRWGDQDALGHVNNVVIGRLVEEARIRSLGQWVQHLPQGIGVLVARQEIEYRAVLHYFTEPVIVRCWVSRIGGRSFDYAYHLIDPDGTVCAAAETTLTVIDRNSFRPTDIPEEMRSSLVDRLGDPVDFRRRGQ